MENEDMGRIRALYGAVIWRAVEDYCLYGHSIDITESIHNSAKRWLFRRSFGERHEPMSFHWICVELDLDPSDIRRNIKAYKQTLDVNTPRTSSMARIPKIIQILRPAEEPPHISLISLKN